MAANERMMLIKLHRMGSRWYAGIREGNFSIGSVFGAPTEFPATMSRKAVLAEMKRQTPNLEISYSVMEG